MNLNSRKYRIIFYFILLTGMLIYLVILADTLMFNNIQKVRYGLKAPVELKDFETIVSTIEPDTTVRKKLVLKDNQPYLSVSGFKDVILSPENKKILKRGVLHPTQGLSLFSMGFVTGYFLEMYQTNNLNDTVINRVEQIYSFVYQEISNPFSLQTLPVNDHAISERIQFIVLLSSYLQQYHPEKRDFINKLNKDFNICLHFLLQNDQFTWKTNHGIMQLRSLAQVAGAVKSSSLSNSILKIVDERLTDIIPFVLGNDGVVYESSSKYWRYIYLQLKKISEIDIIQSLPSVLYLKGQLPMVERFMQTVAANDGYMQGVGDGYSYHLTEKDSTIPPNRYFNYSNGLAGANWSSDSDKEANVLFFSLNTPPNVHKLPEDLMVTIYHNKPYFSNTGTYSYNSSESREYFQSNEEAHSTVYFKNNISTLDSSKIAYPEASTNASEVCLTGFKYYANQKHIQRTLKIKPGYYIDIKDISNSDGPLVTQFNLHPDVGVRWLSSKEIELINADSLVLLLSSNCNIELKEAVVSPIKEQLIHTKQLQITGDSIHSVFTFSDDHGSSIKLSPVLSSWNASKRLQQAKMLAKKYDPYKNDRIRIVIFDHLKILMLLFLSIIVVVEFGFYVSHLRRVH